MIEWKPILHEHSEETRVWFVMDPEDIASPAVLVTREGVRLVGDRWPVWNARTAAMFRAVLRMADFFFQQLQRGEKPSVGAL